MSDAKKSRRQIAVDKIMADPKLNGLQKARKISNLIKMTVKAPKEVPRNDNQAN